MGQLFRRQIKHFLRNIHCEITHMLLTKYYRKLLKSNNISNKPIVGEDQWLNKWSVLGKTNPIYYRLFAHYIGPDTGILPEDICRNVVEPILNPLLYVPYYSDKNIFDKIFKYGILPKTIFRKIKGFYYDHRYNRINLTNNMILDILSASNCQKIVIKPTVDSCSGSGVRIFQIRDDVWQDLSSGDTLTIEYLNSTYGTDFIVQEGLSQADFMSYYCPTSINTLRLTLYKSVVDDECYVPSAIIRIGKKGSLVDNAHAGGGYVGILPETGTLCNRVFDQYGHSVKSFNDIDFSQEHKIPNWDDIVDFAKSIGKQVPHCRLLALDIMVDKTGAPRLIEFNCRTYSMWLFQFTMGSAFGKYTDEVIEYCRKNLSSAHKIIEI